MAAPSELAPEAATPAEPRVERNPYVGPRPFERTDADRFYGRDRETRELLSLVFSHRVALFYAASGAGKTSLLNASLLPALEVEGFEVLPPARVRAPAEAAPAGQRNVYVASVLAYIAPLVHELELTSSLRELLAELPHDEGPDGFPAPRVLVLDQFEELFTAYPQNWQQRPAFFDALSEAVEDDPLLRVVLAIREDYLAQLDPFAKQLPDGLRGRYRLERLGPQAAHRAVTAPLAGTGRSFDAGVAERLIEDLLEVRVDTGDGDPVTVRGEYVEPVALQVACRSLWDALPPDVTLITEEHRSKFGNVDEVLAGFYDEAIAAAASDSHMREGELRSRFERAFVTPLGTRGTVVSGRTETAGIPAAAIAELDRRHLIRAELRAGARWYELTHDRLIEPLRTSNRRRTSRVRRRRVRDALVVAGVLAGAGAASLVALLVSGGHATRTTTVGGGQAASAQALDAIVSPPGGVIGEPQLTPTGSRVVAVGADGVARVWTTAGGAVVGQIGSAGSQSPILAFALWTRSSGSAAYVIVSESGRRPKAVVVADTATTNRLPMRKSAVALAISPGGSDLVAGYEDGSVAMYQSGKGIPLEGTPSPVVALAYSPSGKLLVVRRVDDVQVWQLKPLEHLRTISVANAPAAFFVGDDALAIERADGSAELRLTKRAHTIPLGAADAIATAPRRDLVALAHDDGTIDIDNSLGTNVRTLSTGDVRTSALAFTANGQTLAAGARDGSVRLFSLATDRSTTLVGQRGTITSLAFSANGAYLASTSRDGTIRVWRALPDLVVGARLTGSPAARTIDIQVTNRGAFASAPVLVQVTAIGRGAAERIELGAVAPGGRQSQTIRAPASGAVRYRVEVDPDRTLKEVDRGNDVVTIGVAPHRFKPPSRTSVRDAIVRAAKLGVRKAGSIHYSFGPDRMEGVLRKVRPPKVPTFADNSSFITWCYWTAGAPDPNGTGYNGTGYLGTLATHGTVVAKPKPGDIVLYGAGSIPTFAGIYIGGGKIVFNGSESGPDIRPIGFSSPRQVRTYLEVRSGTVVG